MVKMIINKISKWCIWLFLIYIIQIIFISRNIRIYNNDEVDVLMFDTNLVSYLPLIGALNTITPMNRYFLVRITFKQWSYTIKDKEYAEHIKWDSLRVRQTDKTYSIWGKDELFNNSTKIIDLPNWGDELPVG